MSKAAGACGTAYAEFETFRLSRSSITCRFWAHPCALQKRLHQMWCTSHSTPLRGPLRQIRPEHGGGKGSWLPYKRGVSKPNTAAQEQQQKTVGERSHHEQGGAHREDR
jgi:hypothetical protein